MANSLTVIDSDGLESNNKQISVIVNAEENNPPIVEVISDVEISEPLPWDDEKLHCIELNVFDNDINYQTGESDIVSYEIIESDLEIDENGCFYVPFAVVDMNNNYDITISAVDSYGYNTIYISTHLIDTYIYNLQKEHTFETDLKLYGFPSLPYYQNETITKLNLT